MFDTLVSKETEIQVKCFYHPIFTPYPFFELHTYHSGGTMATFHEGDELPLHTLYYDYPSDFVILLDIGEKEAALVREGKFVGFINTLLTIPLDITHFYDAHGRKIKTLTKDGALTFWKAYQKEPDQRDFILFFQHWTESLTLEQQLGELYSCWETEHLLADVKKDMESFLSSKQGKPMKLSHVEEVRIKIEEFQEQHPELFQSFLTKHQITWVQDAM